MSIQEATPSFAQGSIREVDCSDCVAICCRRGTILSLTPPQAEQLGEVGTDLVVLEEPVTRRFLPILSKPGTFGLRSDCGNLQTTDEGYRGATCGDYDNRPDNCRSFEVGGLACREARVAAGIDSRLSLEQFISRY